MNSASFTIESILGKEKSDIEKPKSTGASPELAPRRPILLPRVESMVPLVGCLYSFPPPARECNFCEEQVANSSPWNKYGHPFANPGRRGFV